MNTCATCKHWTPNGKTEWGTKPPIRLGTCEGRANDYACADADDDQGLSSWFAPAETFGCNGWEAK